ncbi:MAG: HD domain-containing protein [Fimbriimonas sp.]
MDGSTLQDAWQLAVQRHEGQFRDGVPPLPYATHVAEVIGNLRFVGGVDDEALLTAAALHDLLEETETYSDELLPRFGERVTKLVIELTRTEPSAEQLEGLDPDAVAKLRTEMLLQDVRNMSPDAQAIKLADRLSNLRQNAFLRSGKKLSKYLKGTKEMLDIIDPSVNEELHKALKKALKQAKK